MKRTIYARLTQPLKRVQVSQQILHALLVQRLAVARHFVAAKADDLAGAVVIRRQPAHWKVLVLEYALQSWAFFPFGGIRPMAAVAVVVINLASGGLLRVEAEFGVRLSALDIATRERGERKA